MRVLSVDVLELMSVRVDEAEEEEEDDEGEGDVEVGGVGDGIAVLGREMRSRLIDYCFYGSE